MNLSRQHYSVGSFATVRGTSILKSNALGQFDARRCSSSPLDVVKGSTLYVHDKSTLRADHVRLMDTTSGAAVHVGVEAVLEVSFSTMESTSSGTGT